MGGLLLNYNNIVIVTTSTCDMNSLHNTVYTAAVHTIRSGITVLVSPKRCTTTLRNMSVVVVVVVVDRRKEENDRYAL